MTHRQDDWFTVLNDIAKTLETQIEQACQDLVEELDQAAIAFMETSEGWAEQLETTLAPTLEAIDEQLTPLLEPVAQAMLDLDQQLSEATRPLQQTVDPWLNEHPACIGCRNYHGQAYGGTMLVCGIYPYGWEGDRCPDWATAWPFPDPFRPEA